MYRSHGLFLCIRHCKIKVEKAYLVIDSGNLAILSHRLFSEANSYSFFSLPSPSLTSSSLSCLILSSLLPFFSLSSPMITSFPPPIYIVYLFPVQTAIKPATIHSTTIPPFTYQFSLSFLPYTFPTKQTAILFSKLSSVRPSIIIHHSTLLHSTQVIQ